MRELCEKYKLADAVKEVEKIIEGTQFCEDGTKPEVTWWEIVEDNQVVYLEVGYGFNGAIHYSYRKELWRCERCSPR